MDWRLLWAGLLLSLWGQSWGQTATDARNLKEYLFTDNSYDYKIRPITDQSSTIHVYVEFYLLAINSVDERDETLKTTGFLPMYWDDQFLTWTPSDYGDIQYYFYPQNDVWKPDVALKNSYLDYKQLGDKSLNVQVFFDGGVRWSPFQVFQSTCSIDITYFPFDTQTCQLIFTAWSYTKEEVFLEGGAKGIVMEEYEANSAWDVVDTSWYNREEADDASIVFVLKIRRKPLYNLLNLVFPVIMLAILNLFVFTLPCDSGEKASYAVTVFLAFAVFLTIMESSFPQNSDTVAYFAIYVVLETVQSTLITLIALVMIRCNSFDENTRVPGVLLFLARLTKCRTRKVRKNQVATKNTNNTMHLEDIEIKGEKKDLTLCDGDDDTEKPYTWKYVVNALDIIFFVFFFLAFFIATLVCLLTAKYGDD